MQEESDKNRKGLQDCLGPSGSVDLPHVTPFETLRPHRVGFNIRCKSRMRNENQAFCRNKAQPGGGLQECTVRRRFAEEGVTE
ncbi:hypothetical protein [Tropicibacter alexandrii]|uniref:hypothetical protein n=1 Tax=Tropicibacter alexandrii TaxID=2267683 RepID=UPI0013E8E2D3|nr:hypothetical protein [Tropicibacter alexandrii]